MDLNELAGAMFGKERLEDKAKLSTTSTISGVAVGNSQDGKVRVVVSDDITVPEAIEDADVTANETNEVELATEVHVEEGDSVSIGLVGAQMKSPRVTGVVGGGDRMQAQVENAETLAGQAEEVARRTNEHFWTDGQGAHVTEYEQDLFTDPTKEEYQSGANVLINSIGQLFRDGLTNLLALLPAQKTTETFTGDGSTTAFTLSAEPNVARPMKVTVDNEPTTDYTINGTALTFSTAPSDGATIVVEYRAKSAVSALAVYDGMGNGSENITASFSSSGATIGKEAGAHIDITPSGMTLYDYWGADAVDIGSMSPTGQVVAQSVVFTPTSLGKAVVTLTDRYANTPVLVTVRRRNETKRASLTDNGSATLDFTDGSCLVTLYNTQLVVSGNWSSGTAEFSTGDTTPYIALGNSSRNTLIELCAGEGTISYDNTALTIDSDKIVLSGQESSSVSALRTSGNVESVASVNAAPVVEELNTVTINATDTNTSTLATTQAEVVVDGTTPSVTLQVDNNGSGSRATLTPSGLTTTGTVTAGGNLAAAGAFEVNTTDIDATLADNGVTSTRYVGDYMNDSNRKALGAMEVIVNPNGTISQQFYVRNYNTNGTSAGFHGLKIDANKDGSQTVNLVGTGAKAAWLSALGLDQPLITTRKQTVTVAANQSVLRDITAPTVSGYAFSHWLQPASSGHITSAYMADPTAQTTNLWVPGNATSSTRSFVVTAVYYLATS